MHKESGAVTLFMSLIILLALTLIVIAGGKSARVEQLASANETRTLEVFHAAEAGLEYGIRWLANHKPVWVAGICTQNLTLTAPAVTAGSGHTYNQMVTYCRNATTRDFVLVRATATSAQEATITASVQQYVRPNTILSPGYLLDSPPLVVNGCVQGAHGNAGVTGTPDVFTGVGEDALETSQSAGCIDIGHLNLHGGLVAANAFEGTAWQYLFGALTKAQFQSLAATETAAVAAGLMNVSDRSYFWVTDTDPWSQNLGSPTHPVILAFAAAANCPQTNGGVLLYGVIYYEDPACGNQGWGGANIYGTAAFEGDLSKFNANVSVSKFSLGGNGAGMEETLPYVGAPKIVGTWKDF